MNEWDCDGCHLKEDAKELEKKADRWDRLIEFYERMELFAEAPTVDVEGLITHSHGRWKFAKEFIDVFDRVLAIVVSGE